MKRILGGTLLVILVLLASGCAKPPVLELSYFYASHCNDCGDVEKKLLGMNDRLKSIGAAYRVEPVLHNLMTDRGFEAFEAALESHGVGLSSRHAPLLLAGEAWFYGEDIDSALEDLEGGVLPPGVLPSSSR